MLAIGGLAASAAEGEGEFGFQGGFALVDRPLSGLPENLDNLEVPYGLRFGYQFTEHWNFFMDGWMADFTTVAGESDAMAFRTGAEHLFGPDTKDHRWFLGIGLGVLDIDLDRGTSMNRTFASAGVGRRYRLGERTMFRWELRADQTMDDDGFIDDDFSIGQFLVGLTWALGSGRQDSDGDGVYDRRDDCPGTPRGAVVDERGCPKDSDGDGVFDGLDKCPDTPKGWPVDADGCPKDSDGDGVPDGKDDCPDTPKGAVVDEKGCPKDSDGDGVYDGIDKCPDTPKGATVDANGCPKDSDGDGVYDGIDRCPDTPKGAKVDAKGCPLDSDGDGVYDGIDKCPGTPKGTPVDATGCPKSERLFGDKRTTLILEGVNFEHDSAILTSASTEVLDRVAQSLNDWPEVRVEVGGHTDSTGSDGYNLGLSERRAKAVYEYLIGEGVAAGRMTSRGYGEANPIADNSTSTGRAKNRRVELRKLD
jgi:outer membrane protein OmpA-like peptidoglycan-associated protein